MASHEVRLLFPVSIFLFALYGIVNYATHFEKNMCEMTYMFEHPEYIKIPLKFDTVKNFPRYDLYVYGEGKYAEELRNEKISGIPVLFIPGSAGSYRQVRSLGSVAMRMAYTLQTSFHFNFFSADFKGEISGLYGGVLDVQTGFVLECIRHIRSLYSPARKIILIGHSMGGIIARGVFSQSEFDASWVSIIFTLASPHKAPVFPLDYMMASYYGKVMDVWNINSPDFPSVPVISIGGGNRDILVRSDLTFLDRTHKKKSDIFILTSAIPGVWVSTDHLAIVWCKQLVLTISRTLFDLVDESSLELSKNSSLIQQIIYHHFVKRSRDLHFPKLPYPPFSTFSPLGQWILQEDATWRMSRSKVLSSVYILIPLFTEENVIVLASGMVNEGWVFSCKAESSENGSKMCMKGENLSHKGEIVPSKSKNSVRKMINVGANELLAKGITHLVIYIAPTSSQVDLLGERFRVSKRLLHVTMPPFFQRMYSFSPFRVLTIPLSDNSVFYNITLSSASAVYETCTLVMETRICKSGSILGQGFMRFHVPWSREDHYYHIRTMLGGQTIVPIELHLLPPKRSDGDVQLQIIMDPECSYILYAQFPVGNIVTQFMKFYGWFIPGYIVALLLAILSGQLYSFGAEGTCPTALEVLSRYPTFISLVMLPTVLHEGVWKTEFGPSFLPKPDNITYNETKFYFELLLRSVLYAIAYGAVISFCLTLEATIAVLSSTWIWLIHRTTFKATETPLAEIPAENFKIHHPALIGSAVSCALAICFSGSVAFLFGTYISFVKLLSLRAKSKAEEDRRGSNALTSKWHVHFTLALLWICGATALFPSVISWFKGIQFSFLLGYDPHKVPCIVILIVSGILWQIPVPSSNRCNYRSVAHMVHLIASLTVLFGLHSAFRLLYFICSAFVLMGVQQVDAFFYGSHAKKNQ